MRIKYAHERSHPPGIEGAAHQSRTAAKHASETRALTTRAQDPDEPVASR